MIPKQNSLFNPVLLEPVLHARTSDPWTSHAAAREIIGTASNHCAIVLQALQHHGSGTQHEIAARTGLHFSQVHKRLSDLEHDGKARKNGAFRKGPSGRYCLVWEAIL